jgi:hypothetical protein
MLRINQKRSEFAKKLAKRMRKGIGLFIKFAFPPFLFGISYTFVYLILQKYTPYVLCPLTCVFAWYMYKLGEKP